MSYFCHPLVTSGPYPTPCHYVTRLLAPGYRPGLSSSSPQCHSFLSSLSLCTLSPFIHHPPVLNTVDLGLTSTPGSWLVRNPSSPQARLRSQTLSGWRPVICLYRPSADVDAGKAEKCYLAGPLRSFKNTLSKDQAKSSNSPTQHPWVSSPPLRAPSFPSPPLFLLTPTSPTSLSIAPSPLPSLFRMNSLNARVEVLCIWWRHTLQPPALSCWPSSLPIKLFLPLTPKRVMPKYQVLLLTDPRPPLA